MQRRWIGLMAGMLMWQATGVQATTREPWLADYPAQEAYRGQAARLDAASHVYARRYRSVLSGALAQGPNFAGHYVLATWGCGTSCEAVAIIDAHSGRVFVPKETKVIAYNFPCDQELVRFSRDSRLLILTRSEGDVAVTDFLVWENGRFRNISNWRQSVSDFCRLPSPAKQP